MSLVLFFADPTAKSLSAQGALHLPDAPTAAVGQTSAQTDAPAATGQSGSQTSPAPGNAPPLTPEEQRKKAEEQLKQEEKQRVWAVVATFNTTANQGSDSSEYRAEVSALLQERERSVALPACGCSCGHGSGRE